MNHYKPHTFSSPTEPKLWAYAICKNDKNGETISGYDSEESANNAAIEKMKCICDQEYVYEYTYEYKGCIINIKTTVNNKNRPPTVCCMYNISKDGAPITHGQDSSEASAKSAAEKYINTLISHTPTHTHTLSKR